MCDNIIRFEVIQAAVKDVKDNRLSLRAAAGKYGLPKSTLSDHVNGRYKGPHGKQPVFSTVEEDLISAHVEKVADLGFPISRFDLRMLAKFYLEKDGRNISIFKNNLPGEDWVDGFLRRNPQLHLSMERKNSVKRAKYLNMMRDLSTTVFKMEEEDQVQIAINALSEDDFNERVDSILNEIKTETVEDVSESSENQNEEPSASTVESNNNPPSHESGITVSDEEEGSNADPVPVGDLTEKESELHSMSCLRDPACPKCDKFFGTLGLTRRHLRVHTKEKPFACSMCGANFSQTQSRERHMLKMHNERPWECNFCDQSFELQDNLMDHLMMHLSCERIMAPSTEMSAKEKYERQKQLAKERARRYRARLSEERKEERKKYDRDRIARLKEQNKIKRIKDLTPSEQREMRKYWRERNQVRSLKQKALTEVTNNSPVSPVGSIVEEVSEQKKRGRKQIRRDKAKAYRTVEKQKKQIRDLGKT